MEREKRRVRIKGIVLPVEWDEGGNTIKVAIFTANEEVYLVGENANSTSLLSLLQREVDARGLLREETGQKVINVERYKILKRGEIR